MKEIGIRLRNLLNQKGLTPYSFSKKTGISQSTISRILNNNSKPNESNMEVICSFFNINEAWLLTGEGSQEKPQQHQANNEVELIPIGYKKVHRVPVYAQAGFLNGYGDETYMDELPYEFWEVDREYKGNYLCFEVKGDSMDNNDTDSLLEGDRILCREIQQHHWQHKLHINKWDFVIVHKDKGIVVKRITAHNTNTGIITCHSLNDYYDDFDINLKDVVALYNIVDMKRKRRR